MGFLRLWNGREDDFGKGAEAMTMSDSNPSCSTAAEEGDSASNCSHYSVSSGGRIGHISHGNIHDFYDIDESELDDLVYSTLCEATPRNEPFMSPRLVKAISKSKIVYPEHLGIEVQIMKLLNHSNIAKVCECFEDDSFIYLVTELCDGGNLFDYVSCGGPLNESDVAIVMKQVFSAVRHMHYNGVVHRDLTCENIDLQDRGPSQELRIAVAGLGRAAFCSEASASAVGAGSSHYAAPEVQDHRCGRASDLWSCGCIMFVLLCGYPPFIGRDDAATLLKIRKGSASLKGTCWRHVSPEAKDLMQKLLRTAPHERFTAEQALNHVWMQ